MPTDLTLYGLAATPLILGAVEALKQAGLDSKFAPMVSLALGLLAGEAGQYTLAHPDPLAGAVIGVAVGLSASGLFSGIAKFTAPDPPPTVAAPQFTVTQRTGSSNDGLSPVSPSLPAESLTPIAGGPPAT